MLGETVSFPFPLWPDDHELGVRGLRLGALQGGGDARAGAVTDQKRPLVAVGRPGRGPRQKFSLALVVDQAPGKPGSQAARQRRSAAAPDRDAGLARGGHRRKPQRLRTTQRAHTVPGLITVFRAVELQMGAALPAPNQRLIRTSSARAIRAGSTKSDHRTVRGESPGLGSHPSSRDIRVREKCDTKEAGEEYITRRAELIPRVTCDNRDDGQAARCNV